MGKSLALTVLLVVFAAFGVLDPRRGHRDAKALHGHQPGFQEGVEIGEVAGLGGGVQALRITRVVIAANTAGIDGDAEPFVAVARAVKGLAVQQVLHHLLLGVSI